MLTVQRCSRCERHLKVEAFTPSNQGKNGAWCRECHRTYNRSRYGPLTCVDCGTPYDRSNQPGRRGRRCSPCLQAQQERRLRRRGTRPGPTTWSGRRALELRAEVLATEDTCGFCGEPVDKTLPRNHPRSPTVDHIVPISLGGAIYDRTNVRLAHLSCNASAGARLVNRSPERVALIRAALWIGDFL